MLECCCPPPCLDDTGFLLQTCLHLFPAVFLAVRQRPCAGLLNLFKGVACCAAQVS